MSQIVIVTGPSGAGKSSVCESLAQRYDRTIHLETDALYPWIRMGFIHPMRPESNRQNVMIARAAARAATAFAQEQYAVFVDGVIGPHLLPVYLEELAPAAVSVHVAILLPPLEVTLARVNPRTATFRLSDADHRTLHAGFVAGGRFAGCLFDNSAITADECADAIMDACGRGDCLVRRPD